MVDGYITLSRKIRTHWLRSKPEYFMAFVDILFEVNFKDNTHFIDGELIECGRGQSTHSLDGWATVFGKGWTKQKVRTFFKKLETASIINTQGLRKTTRLTVLNYSEYQLSQHGDNTQNNTELTQRQHGDNTELTPIEERKKEDTVKKEDKKDTVHEFDNLWDQYGYKKNREKALSSFSRMSKKDKADMLDKLPAYIESTNTNGVYPSRMMLSTFINGKRWNDELAVSNSNSGYESQNNCKPPTEEELSFYNNTPITLTDEQRAEFI